jgi:hypothetical protein
MVGEQPSFYSTHFWATGAPSELAQRFKAVLDVQATLPSNAQ